MREENNSTFSRKIFEAAGEKKKSYQMENDDAKRTNPKSQLEVAFVSAVSVFSIKRINIFFI